MAHPPTVAGAPEPAFPSTGRARQLAALVAVLAVAALARFGPWKTIFTPDGVLLAADGDTYYHALRAEWIARDWPHVPWFDAGMNHPFGAEIPWPPLLDQIVASASKATGPPEPDHVAGVAAVVPALAGILVVAVVAALGAAVLGGGPWWDAGLLVALVPVAVRQSFVGRADHHVLEVLLSSLVYLAYLMGLRREREGWLWPALLGSALALAFWNWAGSPLYLLVLSAHLALVHLLRAAHDPLPGRAARLLGRGALVAAALLAASVAAWASDGAWRSFRLTPITGLSVAVSLATAASALLVAGARRWSPGAGAVARAATLGAAALLPGVLVAVAPSRLASGVTQGLGALGASSAWYAGIPETWPIAFSGRQPWTQEMAQGFVELGLTLVLAPVAAWLLYRSWSRQPERRDALAFLGVWCGVFVLLAVMQRRFGGYAAAPLAICSAWVMRELGSYLGRRYPAHAWIPMAARLAGLFVVLLPGLPLIVRGDAAELPVGAYDKVPLLDLLRVLPSRPGAEGVLSTWQHGHEIRWFARKPVVSTPFGTDIDVRSLEGEAEFLHAREPEAAEAVLRRRQVGYLLLENPVREVATLAAFAPGSAGLVFEEHGVWTGNRYAFREEFLDVPVSRLYFFDGGSQRGDVPWLGGYRLLMESPTPIEVLGIRAARYKLLGVVQGATILARGAPPGARVSASVGVRSNIGRAFTWAAWATVDAAGEARLRVPYATGRNGLVLAGPYRVGTGAAGTVVPVSDEQVVRGETVAVDLGH
jgi:dolichyl-diphosphooligosaccharide--protein glycosyltransferase